ncbi:MULTISPECIES: MFS transporter [unclassified Cryobacterium]|uniref:MFS transporter n=1 Tax=unclassified Cryobacterium TaxID=2649013 RepID=UPI002AB39085|nr:MULTISPECIES: MFS transporter [unclassified Cryobacterium]MDY7527717.1 MFS transporter [Cryobacterium sp. 10C2]MDY7556507.1 MFS transporter [Cryobacterium sp. 10C3]MEB0001504.1 MFS transporter [Cryobacterium sp. RTC2.1]MEB0200254.1 MFS transporter [Cryobacterium sp. 5I3]MEB0285156.1 MFS transporter [Cryobacterium sp. 10S3]
MSSETVVPGGATRPAVAASWLPLVVVVLTQIQASFAVNALTVSMQGITTDLNTPATSVGTAITAGTFAMAAFILLGAKLGAKFGSRRVFQIAVVIHGLAMAAVAVSVSPTMLFIAQAASGAVIALIAPALVVFIAANYSGEQQARSIGFLAAAIPAAGVLALLIAGTFASTIGWRYSFALIVALAAVNLLLSFRLKVVPPQPAVVIDWVGAVLAAGSIILLSFGFSGLNSWGVVLATPSAPFTVLGVSPAPVLILLGAIGGQAFFVWLRRRKAAHLPQIFDLEVLKSGSEKATTFAMAAMLFVGTAANFLIPLYIQIVQGRSSFQTSISIIPYTLSIFIASSVVATLYKRYPPHQIARVGFVVVALGLVILAFTIRNEWEQFAVVIGLIILGLGQGAIVALVFNTLLSAAPKRLAGDVGAWRGLVHNISGSVGIAVASVFAVGILSAIVASSVASSQALPPELVAQVPLDSVNFVTNDHLESVLSQTSATPEQVAEAVAINEDARLRALQISLLGLAGIALLAIIPAGRMPDYIPGDIPAALSSGKEPDDDEDGLERPASRS